MNATAQDSWTKFLNPESLQSNLILASLFIASYETLKDSIVEQLKDFYTHEWDESGPVASESYQSKVLALDAKRNPFRASIAWLKNDGVINEADERLIGDLTRHRNEVAHELPKFISESGKEVQTSRLAEILSLVTKIDRWWIMNVELSIRDDIDPDKVAVEGIVSGRMLFLQLLYGIATGAQYKELYKEFAKLSEMQTNKKPEQGGSPSMTNS